MPIVCTCRCAVSRDSAKANNLDVLLAFDAPATRAARALLFEGIPEFGAVQGKLDIRSESGDPSFENIVVSARDPRGIEVDMSGRIASFPLDPARSNLGYDLDVSMKAKQVLRQGRSGRDQRFPERPQSKRRPLKIGGDHLRHPVVCALCLCGRHSG
jgi:hypothetical protein